MLTVSTAVLTAGLDPGANTLPEEPPPTDENTEVTLSTCSINCLACSATRVVSSSVDSGGSSTLTTVCERSPAGTKPVGSKVDSQIDPTKKAVEAIRTSHGCLRQLFTELKYHFITRESFLGALCLALGFKK